MPGNLVVKRNYCWSVFYFVRKFGLVGNNYSIQRAGHIKGSTDKKNGEIFFIYCMQIFKKIWKRSVAESFTRKIFKNI